MLFEGQATEGLRVLKEQCFSCHNEKKDKAGFIMTSREAMLKGSEYGDAIDLKEPGKSRILELLSADADPHMPPKGQLTDGEIVAVRAWLEGGAKWDPEVLKDGAAPLKWLSLAQRYRPVGAVAASPNGEMLAIGRGSKIEIFNQLADKEPAKSRELSGHRDAVQSLAWSKDGAWLASGGFRRLVVWEPSSGEKMTLLEDGLLGRITGAVFVAEDKFLVIADSVAAETGRLLILESGSWKVIKTIDAHSDAIYSLTLSPNGKLLASASADKLVHLWNVETWDSAGTLEGHTGFVLAAAFSPDSERMVTSGDDSEIKVWNLATRKQITSFDHRNSNQAITGLYWTLDPNADKPKEDDDWIVSISADKRPRVFTKLKLHDGTQRSGGASEKTLSDVGGELTALAFSSEAKLLVTGDTSGSVTLWNTKGEVTKRIE